MGSTSIIGSIDAIEGAHDRVRPEGIAELACTETAAAAALIEVRAVIVHIA